ncbi:MAG: N(5)-(carboxyethyl)ornithine synthase [Solirubrobacterales bacterium]|nr:N(5)-(carboxyethyl)ornithine synthase [Solirubrobacterales bacterium]MBV9166056.1 N(5)-(carboxyethyl)ornithine synthase [Solirubrobacterales bacterium]MBV9535817.1 N(5)-(carboxyethyl)ornithine synthase [Solirubrobacterales bacterium]
MERLSLGIVGTSRKPAERRLPIHPDHLERIDPDLRARISLERGYGHSFEISDERLAKQVGHLRSREELFAACEVVVLPKPAVEDLHELPAGGVLWGWPHSVQQDAIAQAAIDRRLTLIAWEGMHYWTAEGGFRQHVFHKNNELAGYSSVIHALQCSGSTGAYGRELDAAVMGFGAAGRGAVRALLALGLHDVAVLTHRSVPAVADPIPPARLVHYERDSDDPSRMVVLGDSERQPVAQFLAEYDLVVNCVLQDPDAPLMFITSDELGLFSPKSLIVDVSCDEAMGFSWARPTSFAEPMFTVGPGVRYYAVDNSPSYLWNSATWEISEALIPFLAPIMAGAAAWEANETIRRAIDIKDGRVQNAKILTFQSRSSDFPYPKL